MERGTRVCLDFLEHIIIKYKTNYEKAVRIRRAPVPSSHHSKHSHCFLSLNEIKLPHTDSSNKPHMQCVLSSETRNSTSTRVHFFFAYYCGPRTGTVALGDPKIHEF